MKSGIKFINRGIYLPKRLKLFKNKNRNSRSEEFKEWDELCKRKHMKHGRPDGGKHKWLGG